MSSQVADFYGFVNPSLLFGEFLSPNGGDRVGAKVG
jgi:hypothetical protein